MKSFDYRLKKARDFLEERGLSGFLFSSPVSVFYLTGLRASHAYVLISREVYLLTDARYYDRAKETLPKGVNLVLIMGDTIAFLKRFFKSLDLRKIGYESDRMSCEFVRRLRSRAYRLIPVSQPLKDLRIKKDESEIEKIKRAVKIVDKIYRDILDFLKSDITELQLRGKIVELAFKYGAEGEAFPAIVATGSHSAVPHWESSGKKISSKGPLLIDMGVVFEGYCSDFTRTLYIGKADQEFRRIYEIVKEAWFRGLESAKPGKPVYEIDRAIREFFEKKGLLQHFTHATGHGIGLEIHEPPRIYYYNNRKYLKSQPLLEEGMVFTIEPGLYFPDRFGIRLENVVFMGKDGPEFYSDVSLDLVEL